MDKIIEYFPDLSATQIDQFKRLKPLFEEWNEQINVISRKDVDNFYERHVLHSLGIALMVKFTDGTEILDVGTGGGFPGIPLAILFPKCKFLLVDSIAKKMKVVDAVVEDLGLKNVRTEVSRSENVKRKFDFVVSRAVSRMNKFIPMVKEQIKVKGQNSYPNGILYLKGGDLEEELSEISYDYEIFDLKEVLDGTFFETKKVVYVRLTNE